MYIGDIFEEFKQVINENNNYIIGIVDKKCIIKFCSKESLVGKYIDIKKNNLENIFYEIKIDDRSNAYLWVNGSDENLPIISKLLYDSLSVRLLYESNQFDLDNKKTKDDELVKYLLKKDSIQVDSITKLIKDLEINKDLPRVCIYIFNKNGFDTREIVNLRIKPENSEIIASQIDNHTLLIFKDVPKKTIEYENEILFKNYITEYIYGLYDWGITGTVYVGTIQNKFKNYYYSYESCKWLKEYILDSLENIYFISDNYYEYFIKDLNIENVEKAYDFYYSLCKDIDLKELIEIENRLEMFDFNLTKTAESLYLHKNTLIYKIKKYEEIFKLDIRNSFYDKITISLIVKMFKEKIKQVGDDF